MTCTLAMYNKLPTKSEVSIAGYWPLCVLREAVWVPKKGPISDHVDQTSLVDTGFVTWHEEHHNSWGPSGQHGR